MIRFLTIAWLFALGCSDDPSRPDAAVDSAIDAATDSGLDSGDAGPDAADSGRDGGDTSVDAGDPSWALLSLNLHCLETEDTRFADNAARFAAIANDAVAAGVRVLLLQEVCDDGVTDALAVLEAALESASGRAWHGAFAPAHLAWEGTPREANEGVGILADVALEDVRSFEHHAQGSLRRVMLSASLPDELRNVTVTTFHLDHADDVARPVQARELATWGLLYTGVANALVGGDLNAREGTPAHAALVGAGYLDASDTLRSSRIDHVFVHRGASAHAVSAELLWEGPSDAVSDHPGILTRLAERAPMPAPLTTIELDVDAGFGNTVFVRGDSAPLSWTEGWPALNAETSLWRFATTELSGSFEYKALRNDTDWSTGENLVGTAGTTQREAVSF